MELLTYRSNPITMNAAQLTSLWIRKLLALVPIFRKCHETLFFLPAPFSSPPSHLNHFQNTIPPRGWKVPDTSFRRGVSKTPGSFPIPPHAPLLPKAPSLSHPKTALPGTALFLEHGRPKL